ncbi:hypothetical protein [Arundinibacter roseus]|uniref:Uncharacterized protein n=1 Tax=Arundinibacter roseus TaxID=2070510 RepID=A0A4R4KLF0_9BACT|nr:hypothetical protein [Arundinibacter roseus]TDB69088.1 hypothetical protein EZE20_01770 [Arundinibacter roseus]
MIIQQANLGGYSAPNVGYIRQLFLLDIEECVSVLDPIRNQFAGSTPGIIPIGGITVILGAILHRMAFPPKGCTMSINYAGLACSYALSYDLPGTDVSLMNFYSTAKNRQYLCLIEDNNGRCYLIGNEERGLRLSLAQSISAAANSNLSLSGQLNVPPFQLLLTNGLVLADVFPESEFSIGFSLDFNA